MKRIKILITFFAFSIAVFGQFDKTYRNVTVTENFNKDGDTVMTAQEVRKEINDSVRALVFETTGVDRGELGDTASNIRRDLTTAIYLDSTQTDRAPKQGLLYHNKDKQNLVYHNKRLNTSWDLGREGRKRGINTTGITILNGQTVIVNGDSDGIRTIGLANAKYDSTALGTIGFATEDIIPGDTGEVATWGEVNVLNTIGMTSGYPAYLDTVDGGVTQSVLPSPNWIVLLGNVGRVDAVNGSIDARVDVRTKTNDVLKIFNGAILESHAISIVYSGSNAYLKIEKAGGGKELTLFYEGTTYRFMTPDSVLLSSGSDAVPTRNWVYVPNSTKQLTVSTSSFPTAEQYVPVADILMQSVTSAQTYGVYKVHAWTDHLSTSVGQGHLSDVNKWIRNQNATWLSGVVPSVSVGVNPAAIDTVKFSSSSGQVLQLHSHLYPAVDLQNGDHAHIFNDQTTPYTIINNLGSISTDTEGNTLRSNNTYYSLVVWGSVSEDSKDCQVFVNKPSGFYTVAGEAISDAQGYSVYTIPINYRGTGFLIARINLRYQTSAGGTFTVTQVDDLRGLYPSTGAGGGTVAGGGSQFFDNAFQMQNIADNTKVGVFDLANVPTGTTSALIWPATSGTIAKLSNIQDTTSVSNRIDAKATITGTANTIVTSDGAGNGVGYADFKYSGLTPADGAFYNSTTQPTFTTHLRYAGIFGATEGRFGNNTNPGYINETYIGYANSQGVRMLNETATTTNPVFVPNILYQSTGYSGGNGFASIIVSGTERLQANTTGVNVVGDFTVNGSPVSGGAMTAEAINDSIKFRNNYIANDTVHLTHNNNYMQTPLVLSNRTRVVLDMSGMSAINNHCEFDIIAYNEDSQSIIYTVSTTDGSLVNFDSTKMVKFANKVNRWVGSVWYNGTTLKTDIVWVDTSAIGDIDAPYLASATTLTDSTFNAIFNENVLMSDTLGLRLSINDTLQDLASTFSGSGTNTITLKLKTDKFIETDTIKLSALASNSITDASGNGLEAFTDSSVTNTIGAGIPTDYLAYWEFSGNANDLGPGGYDLTVDGATLTTDKNGNTDEAYSFDGSGNSLYVTGAGITIPTTFTVCWWSYSSNYVQTAVDYQYHLDHTTSSTAYRHFFHAGSSWGVANADADNDRLFLAYTNPSNLAWHFNKTVVTNDTAYYYLDGTLQTVQSILQAEAVTYEESTGFDITIGNGSAAATNGFAGKLDKIRIYGRELTEEEDNALLSEFD